VRDDVYDNIHLPPPRALGLGFFDILWDKGEGSRANELGYLKPLMFRDRSWSLIEVKDKHLSCSTTKKWRTQGCF
jgi:hypothetical protein